MIALPYCWDPPKSRARQISALVGCPFDVHASIVLAAALHDAEMLAPHLPQLHAGMWTHPRLREMARSALADVRHYGIADQEALHRRLRKGGRWRDPEIDLTAETLKVVAELVCPDVLADAVRGLTGRKRVGI